MDANRVKHRDTLVTADKSNLNKYFSTVFSTMIIRSVTTIINKFPGTRKTYEFNYISRIYMDSKLP